MVEKNFYYIFEVSKLNDMEIQQQEEKKLRVKLSTFQTDLSFNEWVEKYNVSSNYQEPTKYFQGNVGAGIQPMVTLHENPIVKFFNLFTFNS